MDINNTIFPAKKVTTGPAFKANPFQNAHKPVQETIQQKSAGDLNFLGYLNFISFGAKPQNDGKVKTYPNYKLELNSSKRIPQEMVPEVRGIASSQITSKPSWNVSTPNVWMVTSETKTFMKTGGLGDVAVDLPEAFNKEFNSQGAKMTIVQPLYESGDLVKLTDNKNGTYTYTSKPMGGSINLVDTGVAVNVPIGDGKSTTVRVLKGELNGTEYRFLQNEEFFGGLPNDGKKVTPYIKNKSGVEESERFAFLSKATAYYIKELKETNPEDAPNVIDANDWHAGPLAAQLKVLMPAKAANKDGISQNIANELKELPIVYTVHNLEYQGWDNKNTSKILNMLYEDYADSVFTNSYMPNMTESIVEGGKKNLQKYPSPKSVMVRDTYNAAIHGLALADAVIAVSPNYAREIATDKFFGYDFVSVLDSRHKAGNLTGIVNGIGQGGIAPDGGLAKKVYGKLAAYKEQSGKTDLPEFKLYSRQTSLEDFIEAKTHNKKAFIKLLQQGAFEDEKYLGVKSTDGSKLEFLKESEIEKTPLLTMVSRLEGQKGIDLTAAAIRNVLTRPVDKTKPLPVVVILGNGGDENKLNALKKQLPPELSKRVVFMNAFSVDLMHMIQAAGDMFIMPSKFEPCGLGQLQAMAKGNIPVATPTGGLSNTIVDGKTGFLSKEYVPEVPGDKAASKQNLQKSARSYNQSLKDAIRMFYNKPESFNKIAYNAMQENFSWKESGSLDQYLNLFSTGSTEGAEEAKKVVNFY
jgi:starch synthase